MDRLGRLPLAIVDGCPLTDREIDVLRATSDIAARLHLAEAHSM